MLEKSMIIYQVTKEQYKLLVSGLKGHVFHKVENDCYLIRVQRNKFKSVVERFAPDAKIINEFAH